MNECVKENIFSKKKKTSTTNWAIAMAITAAAAVASSSLRFLPFSTPTQPPTTQHSSLNSICWRQRITKLKSLANGDMLGDFGGRDPFPAEIESGFGEKVGNFNTEHRILIPNITSLSLSQQKVVPHSPLPISHQDAQSLLRKVVGWRLVDDEKVGGLKLQCVWKLRDFKCGVELINRIYGVVEVDGHYPNLHLEQNPSQVRAELWTSSIGGLSMNDFIVAAKIDGIKTSDLVPKRRAWA